MHLLLVSINSLAAKKQEYFWIPELDNYNCAATI
jgi:hypothetical protein